MKYISIILFFFVVGKFQHKDSSCLIFHPLIITNQNRFSGCDCNFYVQNEKADSMLVAINRDREAWINVTGENIKLNFIRTTDIGKDTTGKKFTEYYSNKKYFLQIDYTLTHAFNPEDGDTYMDVVVTIQKGKLKSIIRLSGGCHCWPYFGA